MPPCLPPRNFHNLWIQHVTEVPSMPLNYFYSLLRSLARVASRESLGRYRSDPGSTAKRHVPRPSVPGDASRRRCFETPRNPGVRQIRAVGSLRETPRRTVFLIDGTVSAVIGTSRNNRFETGTRCIRQLCDRGRGSPLVAAVSPQPSDPFRRSKRRRTYRRGRCETKERPLLPITPLHPPARRLRQHDKVLRE